jgi:CheY-like chemotaxis protein
VKRSSELAVLTRVHHVALELAWRLQRATDSDAAMTVAAARFVGGAARRGRRMTRSLIVVSFRVGGSGRQFYARAGDSSATGDVGRMSCRPGHTGGMRVLVVEDHATLAGRIAQGLRQAGMAVDAVYDGAAALEAAALTAYDVILLDRDLPVVHGDRVCRAVAGSGARILMLTAAAGVEDRVDGLEMGADDYLGKPFVFAELVARVRALSRRVPSAPPVVRRGDLSIDRARHRASRDSRPLSLTRKEFASWRCCWPPTAPWSARRNCSSMCGTPTPTRSATSFR